MSTVTETIPTFVDIPTTADPTNFDAEADDFLGTQLPAFVASANTWAGQVNVVAGEVNTNTVTASTAASDASASEEAAAASAIVAQGAANFVGLYSSLSGAKTAGISAEYQGVIWILLESSADITADVPGVSAKWARAYGGGIIYPRTTNIEFSAEDNGKIFQYTSGTFSQTFDAAANLREGWFIYAYNTGTGVITLNPDGAELIDGAATKVLPKDALSMILCTGTALVTIPILMPLSDSHVTVTTGNGYGAVNTKARRYTTTLSSAGTALTYADSANDGGSITVNEAALYEIYCADSGTSTTTSYGVGVSVNSNQLTTNIDGITASHRIMFFQAYNHASPGGGAPNGDSRTVRLAVGDVIRCHAGGPSNATSTQVYDAILSVRKVGL